jgi:hypothetical protein
VKRIFLFGVFLFFFFGSLWAQSSDTLIRAVDSLKPLTVIDSGFSVKTTDSLKPVVIKIPVYKLTNKLLNLTDEPVSLATGQKKVKSTSIFFYLIAFMVLLLAFLKYFFNRYFTNLFRVFFNSSLRQNQLTDQLLQSKLPSFLFNIFFVISGGIYVYILLLHFQLINGDNKWIYIFSSIGLLGVIYFIKFCTLKFTGWITGLEEVVNIYVFIIFLINKIVGIFLVPFIVILFFSDMDLAKIAALVSIMCIGIFLLLRFFRSYGLIKNQLKISKFHFLIYITGLELVPLLLIYKGLMIYLSKNL